MSKEEFESLIAERKEKGDSEEDIVKAFAAMFSEGTLDRKQFEACLDALGYGLSEEFKSMSDDELKEKMFEKDPTPKEEEGGKPAPSADKPEKESEDKPEEKTETEVKTEVKEEKPEGEGEDEERKEAMKLMGL